MSLEGLLFGICCIVSLVESVELEGRVLVYRDCQVTQLVCTSKPRLGSQLQKDVTAIAYVRLSRLDRLCTRYKVRICHAATDT